MCICTSTFHPTVQKLLEPTGEDRQWAFQWVTAWFLPIYPERSDEVAVYWPLTKLQNNQNVNCLQKTVCSVYLSCRSAQTSSAVECALAPLLSVWQDNSWHGSLQHANVPPACTSWHVLSYWKHKKLSVGFFSCHVLIVEWIAFKCRGYRLCSNWLWLSKCALNNLFKDYCTGTQYY